MKSDRIFQILSKFENERYKSILFDGSWGIGKTYNILKYYKQKEHFKQKRIKVYYLSLFGKNSIDEIHTELYSIMHPKMQLIKKGIGIISSGINIFLPTNNTIEKGMEFTLGLIEEKNNPIYKIKEIEKLEQRYTYIVIFDDLERIGNALDYNYLLGYINKLFLSSIKVVGLCNSNEIDKDKIENFNRFKEKIFNRVYKITKTNDDVIDDYFTKQYALFLDDDIKQLFDNNLRLAYKTSEFYKYLMQYLEEKRNVYDRVKISSKTLLWFTSLVIKFIYNTKLSNGIETNIKNAKEELTELTYEYYLHDENLEKILDSCVKYNKESDYISKNAENKLNSYNTISILAALIKVYFYDEFEDFDKYLLVCKKKDKEYSILNDELFYKSTDNKKKYINTFIKYIYNLKNSITVEEFRVIRQIYLYKELLPSDFDENNFANKIADLLIQSDNNIENQISFRSNKDFNNLKMIINKKHIDEIIIKLKEYYNNKNIEKFRETLDSISISNYCRSDDNGMELNKRLEDLFVSNNYFIASLNGDITEEEWEICHAITKLLSNYPSLNNLLKMYFKDILDKSSDLSEKERINLLLNEYLK